MKDEKVRALIKNSNNLYIIQKILEFQSLDTILILYKVIHSVSFAKFTRISKESSRIIQDSINYKGSNKLYVKQLKSSNY